MISLIKVFYCLLNMIASVILWYDWGTVVLWLQYGHSINCGIQGRYGMIVVRLWNNYSMRVWGSKIMIAVWLLYGEVWCSCSYNWSVRKTFDAISLLFWSVGHWKSTIYTKIVLQIWKNETNKNNWFIICVQ